MKTEDLLKEIASLPVEERALVADTVLRSLNPLARILPIKGVKPRPSHKNLRERLPYQDVSSEILQRQDREER